MIPNNEQEEFINSQGNVVLQACPGSGKTTSVALKYQKLLLNWKRKHSGIALLSFTNIASKELENKIKKDCHIENGVNYPHYIGTLDSFFDMILLRFGYLIYKKRPITIISNQIDGLGWEASCYKKSCNQEINTFRFQKDGKLLKNNVEVKSYCENTPLCCERNLKILINNGIITQANVPYCLYNLLLKFPILVKCIKARYPVIFIDEAQDTSKEQMDIIDIFVDNGIVVNLIGDPDQAIYEWRNANVSGFVEKFSMSNWSHLKLKTNRRSSQLICNATKPFSMLLSSEKEYISTAENKDCSIKPILLIYNINDKEKPIKWFLNKCEEENIDINNTAIVQRAQINNNLKIKNMWSDCKMTEYLARASYDWFSGNRKNVWNYCDKVTYLILEGDIKKYNKDVIKDKVYGTNNLTFDNVVKAVVNCISSPLLTLEKWFISTKDKLQKFFDSNGINQDINKIFKMKTRDKNYPNFKQEFLYRYFETTKQEKYFYSTIHGVKGFTFDALMLVIKSIKGNTITPTVLLSNDKNSEYSRMVYVAMTRPRKLLVVATPKGKFDYEKVFNKNDWDIIES